MGEEEKKPKVEGKPQKPGWKRTHSRTGAEKREKYRAPTPGLEDDVFAVGTAQDAANFEEVRRRLGRYVAVNFKNGGAMAQTAIERLEEPVIEEPEDLPDAASRMQEKKWEIEYDKYHKQLNAWDDARKRAYQLVLLHCHPQVEEKLDAVEGFQAINEQQDLIKLLQTIRSIVHKHDEVKGGTMAIVEQDLRLFLGFQRREQTLTEYYKLFKAQCEVIDVFGGKAGYHRGLYRDALKALMKKKGEDTETQELRDEAMKASCEEYKAALFIRIADEHRFKGVKNKLDNLHLFNQEAYPRTLDSALKYLQNYKQEENARSGKPEQHRKNEAGLAFAQLGTKDQKGEYRKRDYSDDDCYNCNEKGHHAKYCPKLTGPEKKQIAGQDHVNILSDDVNGLSTELADMSVQEEHSTTEQEEELDESESGGYLSESTVDSVIEGVGFIQVTRRDKATCDPKKLYLDTCATNHSMFATEFLTRCHTTGVVLRQNCNAGHRVTDRQGFWNIFKFWINEGGIANLLSVPRLEADGWDLEYIQGSWRAVGPLGHVIRFKTDFGMCNGMPYIDMSKPEDFITEPDDGVAMIETVRNNYEGFTKEQIRKAKQARDAMAMMAHPTNEKLKHVVSTTNILKNCPFTSSDLTNATALFGPDRGSVRGKTVRHRPDAVRPEYVSIPKELFERIQNVTIAADVMFVNGLPFLITLSRAIKLVTVEFLPSRTATELCNKLTTVKKLYRRGGFNCRTALMDMEFEKLEQIVEDMTINTTAAREHVGDIERTIRTCKERCRSVTSELPYKRYLPDQFVIHLIYFVVMWMNAFPADNGVSDRFSPRELVTGMKMDYSKHCKARWGSYVEASTDADITNTMDDRTSPCIVLGPTGNFQGSIKCYNLDTNKIVKRRTVTPLPMPDRIIKHIIKLGKKSKQKRTADRLQFLNRHKEQFAWDTGNMDEDMGLVEPDPLPHADILAEIPGIDREQDYPNDDVIEQPVIAEANIAAAAAANANLVMHGTADEITGVNAPVVEPTIVSDDESDADDDNDDVNDDVEFIDQHNEQDEHPQDIIPVNDEDGDDGQDGQLEQVNDAVDYDGDDEIAPPLTYDSDSDDEDNEDAPDDDQEKNDGAESDDAVDRRYPRRKRKKKEPMVVDWENKTFKLSDGVIHINPTILEDSRESLKVMDDDYSFDYGEYDKEAGLVGDQVITHVLGVILLQTYSVQKGLKLFGDRAKQSMTKELKQIHDMKTYTPVHARELTRQERKEALSSLMFLTEKRCGKLKSRNCVDGSPQREYIKKEDAASPTVGGDSVIVTTAIDAHEGRKVATLDIPGAFLHSNLDENVIMILRGAIVDLMVAIDPELYGPYVIVTSKGEKILYVRMLKAMYGLLRSALLFYLKLVRDLKEYGFELNPYDPCVANKMIDGKQMTITWHVDDLKVSHVSNLEITKLIVFLGKKYGNKITVKRGHYHDYLGMDLDYSHQGMVKLSMIRHIDKIFQDFPEDIGKPSASPASDHLFQIRDPQETEKLGKYLSEDRAKSFHHTVAQCLFVANKVRRDIQTTVAFLTTRVKKPDEDDWGKLRRLLKYLKGTKHMKLTLTIDNVNSIRWWVDASYNLHEDCKGQTGAMMMLGKGAPISFSRKQKLNVRSSCEGELVGIDDAMPTILWLRYFIEAQGYTVEQNVLYQDNKSTILLANNGRWSSSKRTKHIKSRYFFVTDKVSKGELTIEHQPTEKMWSDVLTKPKQGTGFRQDRAVLMNVDEDYDDEKEKALTPSCMLPVPEGPVKAPELMDNTKSMKARKQLVPALHRRSVLGDVKNHTDRTRLVTWSSKLDRVDTNDAKARLRHLEVVRARIHRARAVNNKHRPRGRE